MVVELTVTHDQAANFGSKEAQNTPHAGGARPKASRASPRYLDFAPIRRS